MNPARAVLFASVCSLCVLACSCAAPSPSPATTAPTPVSRTAAPGQSLLLNSTAFAPNGEIPAKYLNALGAQCGGQNISLPLAWQNIPAGTRSFVVTLTDPDAQSFVHWVQFNLPPETNVLPETENGPGVGVQGKNSFGKTGYGGPCPPSGTHHYIATLYALDTMLSLNAGASYTDVQTAMQNHVLAVAELIGTATKR